MTAAAEFATVFIIDDEPHMRRSLVRLLKSHDLAARDFASADEFLAAYTSGDAGCLIVDLCMPGKSGLDVQAELKARGMELPIIVISGQPKVSSVVKAVQEGALDFLEKPFAHQVLLQRVRQALELDRGRRQRAARLEKVRADLDLLTPRERQIVDLLTAGKHSKQVAVELGISSKTVDVHRARIMHKMQVEGLVQLVQLLNQLNTR